MIGDVYDYLRDVGGYLGMAARLGLRRLPGFGSDYGRSEFRRSAERAVERLHPRRIKLEVAEIINETPSTRTLRLRRTDGAVPPFRPGQYVNLYVVTDGVRTSRPYSISSPPGLDHMDLTVKAMEGGFVSHYLAHDVNVSDVLESSGPAGGFYHEPLIHSDDLVFLAGGSGVTPFMSIIRDAARRDAGLRIRLLYGCRAPDDVIFGDELRRLAAELDWLTVDLVISEPPEGFEGTRGLLDADLIRDRVGSIDGKTFFVCGPGAMYDLCLAALVELGVERHRIKHELYGPPRDITTSPGWPADVPAERIFNTVLEMSEGEASLETRAGEPLLNSLERHGYVVPATCRSGECSSCRLRLVSGQVYLPPDVGLRSVDRQLGYIHSCVAYPLSDLRLSASGLRSAQSR